MWSNLFLLLVSNFLATFFNSDSSNNINNKSAPNSIPTQNKRFVSLWPVWSLPVVNLKRDPCDAFFQNRIGNCENKFECLKHLGKKDGVCALGFGVCCTYQRTCGAKIYRNNTYFVSRNYPLNFIPSGREECRVEIKKTKRICQIRLDFLETQLQQGNTNGVCNVDNIQFIGPITQQGRVPPNLCGPLAVNSMYLHFETSNRIVMNVITDGSQSSSERKWNIRISFIPCRTEYTAPPDCTQYFTGTSGQVRILGYPQAPHLGDLAYTVCIRSEEGARGIQWGRCPGEPVDQSFWLTGPPFSDMLNVQTGCAGGDFIVLMRTADLARNNDRHCGNSLSTNTNPLEPVRSVDRPFILRVKTDAIEGQIEEGNTGFCLQWIQEF